MKVIIILALISYAFSAHAACSKKLSVEHQHQPTSYSCGPTALAMSMTFHGKKVSGSQACNYLGNCYRSSGTDFEEMIAVAKHYGFSKTRWRFGVKEFLNSIAEVKSTVAIINVQAGTYPRMQNGEPAFYSFTGGHYIEIHGVKCDKKGNISYFIVNDPAQPGWKNRKYTYSSMKSAWGQRDYRFLTLK